MDVKVNNDKSRLGLSPFEASSDIARLGGRGLWFLPNVHKAYFLLWAERPSRHSFKEIAHALAPKVGEVPPPCASL